MLEAYSLILTILVAIFDSVMSLAYFSQVYKMYIRKSSADVSSLTYMLVLTGFIIWLLYGISVNNIAFIVANSIGVISSICVIVTYYHYKKVN